ncbi:hypothetical protein NQ318_023482 [Aromia moschata]|uniref:Kinesin motor domain-containing protein n=1 Tax=Aromia moschata TaxID=1265417 RepID=A0AAV8YQZ7_9CUCU|nr:hypothetical protein NQ318_023482 [Aromia moschata]
MIVNMNPARDMFDETQHVLNFAAVAKEILIEEQQKIVKPKKNRFSQYMERKSLSVPFMQIIEEDEKDIEINKLKIMISDLYMEMEQKRLEYQQELSEEREYIRSEYKKFIEELRERHMQQKVEAINKVKREYEEIIQSLNRNRRCLDDSEVVILDSSSDEDDASERTSKQVIIDLERITTEQNDKIKLLEQNLKCQNEKSNKEISELKEHIRALKEEEFKLKVTLDEAEQAYSELQLELREADTKTKKLISEKLQLQEKVEQLEEVITHLTNDSDESEDDPCQIEHVVGS